MKKIFLITSIIILIITSCNDKKNIDNNNFQINVTVDKVSDGTKAILKKQIDRKITNIDTAVVKNGKFSFEGNIKEPVIFGIFIDSIKRGGIFPFIGLNDKVTVIAYKDSLIKSKITGSNLHDELTRLRNMRKELSDQTQQYLPEFKKANEAKDTVTMNRINKEVKKISNEMSENDWAYVKSHPDSYISPLVFNGLMTNPSYKDSVKIVFNNFSETIKKSDLAKPIREYFDSLDKQNNKSNNENKIKQRKKIETH